MADFNSNFNDIQKQIAVADLTEEQFQALVSALQNRRSTKPQLTKEEKVFFQCCREHRSYANDKDLDTVVCPHCGSVKSIKHGTRNGRQRYFCKDCGKTFGDTNGTVAFRSKLSVGKWIEFIKLTLQGESCRTISAISKYAVCLVWIRTTTTFCRVFVSAEYSLSISSRPLFPISPKILFWLQTAIEHIKP